MKKVFILITIVMLVASVFAQSPEKMSYQAVVRNSSKALVVNTQVGMQISILQGTATGTAVYVETQRPSTNANGLVSIEIGAGYVESGSFAGIDWQNGPYFIKTETDPDGRANYSITGTSQLLSVPFALHAKTAENITGAITETDPLFSAWDKSTGVSITESQISDLRHFTNADEADPAYTADSLSIKEGVRSWHNSLAKKISPADTARWGKEVSETDPAFTAWDKTTGITISESQISDLKHFTNADESDPRFQQSVAIGITEADTANWNKKTSFSGNYQDLRNKPTGLSKFTNDMGFVQSHEISQFLTSESDPTYKADSAYIKSRVRSWDNSLAKMISPADTTRWGKEVTETDPVFTAWDKSTGISITESQISDLDHFTTADETDPVYGASVASGITATDTTSWNNKLDSETDPVFTAWDKDYADLINTPAAADGSETKVTAGTNVTVTGSGTTASPYVVNATSGDSTLAIGDSYQGGIIFWLDATGQHGLIAATADQDTGIQWYNGTYRYTGTAGDGLYAGAMNTAMIVATQMADNQSGSFAAKVCADYSVTVGGVTYGDWYLPSKYELNLLYLQKIAVGGFASTCYWSSTEKDNNNAWSQNFVGNRPMYNKSNATNRVRAVRAF